MEIRSAIRRSIDSVCEEVQRNIRLFRDTKTMENLEMQGTLTIIKMVEERETGAGPDYACIAADYYFIAACYAEVVGARQKKERLAAYIKSQVPEYDPSQRFFDQRLPNFELPVDIALEIYWEESQVTRHMDAFVRRHPDFSFQTFQEVFPMRYPLDDKYVKCEESGRDAVRSSLTI